MPELKNTFTGGRMEKDRDERIVGSGLYKEALNIEVSTSEDSDVGAAQNILGNTQITSAVSGPMREYSNCAFTDIDDPRYYGTNAHIAHTVDPQNDKLYRFVATTPSEDNNHGVWMDRVAEYNTNSKIEDPWQLKERAVMVDIYKVATTVDSIEDGPSTPDPDRFWGCDGGECLECITNPTACIAPGQTIYNEPTCGGNCSSNSGSTVNYCTNMPSLVYPSGGAYGYSLSYPPAGTNVYSIYYSDAQITTDSGIPTEPGFEDGAYQYSPPTTVGQNPNDHSKNLRTHRYPIYNANLSNAHYWSWHYGIGIGLPEDAKDSNGALATWTTPAFVNNISGIQHGITYSTNQVGNIPNSMGQIYSNFNMAWVYSIDDLVRWFNEIPNWDGSPRTPIPLGTPWNNIVLEMKNILGGTGAGNAGWTIANTGTSYGQAGGNFTGAVYLGSFSNTCDLGSVSNPINDNI